MCGGGGYSSYTPSVTYKREKTETEKIADARFESGSGCKCPEAFIFSTSESLNLPTAEAKYGVFDDRCTFKLGSLGWLGKRYFRSCVVAKAFFGSTVVYCSRQIPSLIKRLEELQEQKIKNEGAVRELAKQVGELTCKTISISKCDKEFTEELKEKDVPCVGEDTSWAVDGQKKKDIPPRCYIDQDHLKTCVSAVKVRMTSTMYVCGKNKEAKEIETELEELHKRMAENLSLPECVLLEQEELSLISRLLYPKQHTSCGMILQRRIIEENE
jgi:hypothetical protein